METHAISNFLIRPLLYVYILLHGLTIVPRAAMSISATFPKGYSSYSGVHGIRTLLPLELIMAIGNRDSFGSLRLYCLWLYNGEKRQGEWNNNDLMTLYIYIHVINILNCIIIVIVIVIKLQLSVWVIFQITYSIFLLWLFTIYI